LIPFSREVRRVMAWLAYDVTRRGVPADVTGLRRAIAAIQSGSPEPPGAGEGEGASSVLSDPVAAALHAARSRAEGRGASEAALADLVDALDAGDAKG
jgi:hypothetical protein